jgi:hypothetical protein
MAPILPIGICGSPVLSDGVLARNYRGTWRLFFVAVKLGTDTLRLQTLTRRLSRRRDSLVNETL